MFKQLLDEIDCSETKNLPKIAYFGQIWYFMGCFGGMLGPKLLEMQICSRHNFLPHFLSSFHFWAAGRLKFSLNIKKNLKNSILGIKSCAKSSWPKIKVWIEEKRWGSKLCLPQTCISSIFFLVIPSKQPKNAEIGQNRLFAGDFWFQNNQIFQIMY